MTAPKPAPPRSELEVRLRQLRNPPPPVVRAVLADLVVALIGGLALLFYPTTSANAPGLIALFVIVVMVAGSLLTYLWVELPSGASGVRRRSGWSAVLGFFASVPIAYLVLVVVFQVLKPG